MKFAENNRISHRQLYRQMILTFLAPFLVCLPGKNGIQGMNGFWGIVLAVSVLILYVFILLRVTSGYSDMVRFLGSFWGRIAGVFFLVYIIFTAAYILKILEQIIPRWLLMGIPSGWISFLVIVVCSIGTEKGIQRRGRMAEISGGLLLAGVLLMMVLCLGQIRVDYLQEMAEVERISGTAVVQGGYLFLCGFSGVGLLPFIMRDVVRPGSVGKTIIGAILTVGGILAGVLVLLPAVFGWNRLLTEEYPILPLLAGAALPGNILARFDVLWMGFLLYGLLFALGSLLLWTSGHGKMPSGNSKVLDGGTGVWTVIIGSIGYCGEDVLQKLSGNHICSRTFIYTGAASFLWTEEKNKKNNYSRFGGFYSCIKWMCRNRTRETNVSSCTGSRVVRRWLDTHLRNAGTSGCRRTGKRGKSKFCAVDKRK